MGLILRLHKETYLGLPLEEHLQTALDALPLASLPVCGARLPEAGNVTYLCCFTVLLQLANMKVTELNPREVSLLTVLRFRAAILFLFMHKSVNFSVVMSVHSGYNLL